MKKLLKWSISLVVLSMMCDNYVASQLPKEKVGQLPKEVKTITYTVNDGECLWSIAEKNNKSNMDIRDLIDRIEEVNNLNGNFIYPGQVLTIPNE